MKEAQSRMQEEMRMIREALGLVSCCWCLQEGAGLLAPLPASPSISLWTLSSGLGCHPV